MVSMHAKYTEAENQLFCRCVKPKTTVFLAMFLTVLSVFRIKIFGN